MYTFRRPQRVPARGETWRAPGGRHYRIGVAWRGLFLITALPTDGLPPLSAYGLRDSFAVDLAYFRKWRRVKGGAR